MMKKYTSALVVIMFWFCPLISSAAITSQFDSSLEGWIVVGNGGSTGGVLHQLTGGNPDGYMEATDLIDGTFRFRAPAVFTGDLSYFDGGVMAFDAVVIDEDGEPILLQSGIVSISNGTTTLTKDLAPTGFSTNWENYNSVFSSVEWGVSQFDWINLISNVTNIEVIMDSTRGNDTVGLDNFSLVEASVVPIPSTLLLFLSSITSFLVLRKR